jgi:hypothetical protein
MSTKCAIEERLRRCEEQLQKDEVQSRQVLSELDVFREKVESGDIDVSDEFDDPSVVRHIEELRDRVRRDSAPPLPLPARASTQR